MNEVCKICIRIMISGGKIVAKVLIVDDANFMQITLEKVLQLGSHQVVGKANNGIEAIQLYKETKPEIVLLDITMPEMDGIETISEIMKMDPEAKVIMCSAMGQQKIVVKAIELGAKDFIVKPFDESKVLETVDRVLNNIDS